MDSEETLSFLQEELSSWFAVVLFSGSRSRFDGHECSAAGQDRPRRSFHFYVLKIWQYFVVIK